MTLYLCLFLSGVSGLIYEVVWMRRLSYAFGSTMLAVSISLAVFLGGMAAGAYFFGARARKIVRPARAYALMELVVGAYGAASGQLLAILSAVVAASFAELSPAISTGAQILLAGVALFVPTALMGGTLPVLLATTPREQAGGRFSVLYGANTLGAAAGAVLTGFVLLPRLGLQRTLVVAAVLNLAAAAIAMASARGKRADEGSASRTLGTPIPRVNVDVPGWLLLLVVFVSGFSTLFHEVVWTRALDLIVGNSTRAFSTIVAVFLVGLAAGTATARAVISFRRRSVVPIVLACSLIAAGIAVLGSSWALTESPLWFLELWQRHESSRMVSPLVIAAAVLFVPTFFMGLVFPLTMELACDGSDGLGAVSPRVGRLYSVNTIGCITGALAAGLVAIAWFGLRGSLVAGGWLNVGAAVLVAAFAIERPALRAGVSFAAVAAGFIVTLVVPPWDRMLIASGTYFNTAANARGGVEAYQQTLERLKLRFYREGQSGTVAVVEGPASRGLSIDGRSEGSTKAIAQVLLGHLPFATGRHIQDAFVIGFGTGTTAGMLSMYPVRRIDVVDLEAATFEASRFFEDVNEKPLQNPRVHARVGDGRSQLVRSPRASYDLIVSQPSYPWVSGASKLFSAEFYQLASSRLRHDGVFAQWVQLYDIDLSDVRSLLKTFSVAFPHVLVCDVGGRASELLLLGSAEPLAVSWPAVQEIFSNDARKNSLRAVGLLDEGTLLAGVLFGSAEIQRLAGAAPINTDDNSRVEFSSASTLDTDTSPANRLALRAAAGDPWMLVDGRPDQPTIGRVTAQMALAAVRMRDVARGLRFAQYAVDLAPTAASYQALGDVLVADERLAAAADAWQQAIALQPGRAETLMRLVRYYSRLDPSRRPAAYDDWAAKISDLGLNQDSSE